MRLSLPALFAIGALSLGVGSAGATVLVPMDVDALAASSDLIVRGTAGETGSAWTADRKQIRSTTPVTVSQWVKGESKPVIAVATPGGTVGELTQQVSGAPRFQPGEEVLLFLVRQPGEPARYAITGFSQGKFAVTTQGGRSMITRNLPQTATLGPDGKTSPLPGFTPVPEADFLDQVKALGKAPRP